MLTKESKITNYRNLLLSGLFISSILIRIITAEYVDIGGDNSAKWLWAKHLAEGIPIDHWYQQTVRWPILFPLAGMIKTFGYNPVQMYILPVLFSSLATLMICLIGERLHSLRLGLTAAALTMLFPQMAQTGSQLWPGVFEMGYISTCIWLLLCWADSKSLPLLLLAACVFFLGWGSRVTVIYAFPGLALLIWLPSKNFRALATFSLTIGLLCGIEWGCFWLLSGNPMGRLGILKSTHIVTAGLDISLIDYVLNFKKLIKLRGLIPIWVLCMGASIWTTRSKDPRWRAVGWFYIIYSLLLLYMISSISPLKLAMPVGTRFWGVVAPVGLLILLWSLSNLGSSRPKTAKSLTVILFTVFTLFTLKKIPPINSLVQTHRDYQLLQPILAAKQPVLMEYQHWQPNLIEEFVISNITGQKGKRIPREDHVQMAIIRNHGRMASLFVNESPKVIEFKNKELLSRIGYTVYRFNPPGSDSNISPAAKILFGRKLHSATRLSH